MKLVRFFANLEGRITRKTFWLASIAVLIIDVIVATIAAATAEVFAGETAGYMTMHIVTVAFFYPQLVIALKQAHDLNMSNRTIYAWYIAVIVDYVVIRVTLWVSAARTRTSILWWRWPLSWCSSRPSAASPS